MNLNIFKRKIPKRYVTIAERKRRREMEMQIVNIIGIIFIAMILVMGVVLMVN
tara:strand:- start:362 stop:520 length:159 start_codon:yes stop_codon:yes gene_type:complete